MAIDSQNFEYIYHNYSKIIDELATKKNLNEYQSKRLSDALLMEKLAYDSRYGD